jgi:tetratricopeptide (TPR) repeat protein
MNKLFIVFGLLCCLFPACKSLDSGPAADFSLDEAIQKAAFEIEGALEPGKRTAVVNIDTGSPELSNYIIEELIGQFVQHGKITIVDRNNMNLVQKELVFNMSGYVSDETAQSIGKMVGAEFIVSGALSGGETVKRLRLSAMRVENALPESDCIVNIRQDARYDQMIAAIQSGKITPALVVKDRVESIDDADKYCVDAEAALAKGDYDDAIAGFTKVLSLLPNYVYAYNNLGAAYIYKKEYDKAIQECATAISMVPGYAGAYSNRAAAYFGKGDYDKVIEDCNQAISINPFFADSYGNRGIAYFKKGNNDKAIDDLTRAIDLNPKLVIAYANRGTVYFEMGDYDRAMEDWFMGLKIDPNNREIKENIGTATLRKLLD